MELVASVEVRHPSDLAHQGPDLSPAQDVGGLPEAPLGETQEKTALRATKAANEKLKEELVEKCAEVAAGHGTVKALEAEVAAAAAAATALYQEHEALSSRAQAQAAQLGEVPPAPEALEQEAAQLEEELRRQMEAIAVEEEALAQLEAESTALDHQIETAGARLSSAQQRLEAIESQRTDKAVSLEQSIRWFRDMIGLVSKLSGVTVEEHSDELLVLNVDADGISRRVTMDFDPASGVLTDVRLDRANARMAFIRDVAVAANDPQRALVEVKEMLA